jgi:hypothetical protein
MTIAFESYDHCNRDDCYEARGQMTAKGRQCLLNRSVSGRSAGLGPMAAGNVSITTMNGHLASDIAGAWMTTL